MMLRLDDVPPVRQVNGGSPCLYVLREPVLHGRGTHSYGIGSSV